MSQGILGFKYEEEKHDTGMTGLAGLPAYLDLMHVMGLPELIRRHLQVKQRGATRDGASLAQGASAERSLTECGISVFIRVSR